ncbi:peptidoglycan DD-metalloendopeptidase family protein [Candidatus Gromoviella agglomerans]|uniref:peptidoglycan DD-metalloendopeptidase family protein n=1 Tax=Candidatus Gromoviella agglomerans TaxID=2806609 RepID=UPI001E5A9D2F|nr:peptidoglycan DD-metalloendopeptidase family protein [Candidatus Gromoviella agglomerans]UFX98348.1 Peptidase family M23 [Candidatus Gromoviella agglomerans]
MNSIKINTFSVLFCVFFCGCNTPYRKSINLENFLNVNDSDDVILCHVVKRGENISLIAFKYFVSCLDIIEQNDLEYPYIVYEGDVIKIPKKKEQKKQVDGFKVKENSFQNVEFTSDIEFLPPWDENAEASLLLSFRENMDKLSKNFNKRFNNKYDLSNKSDGIFIIFNSLNNRSVDIKSISDGKVVVVSKNPTFGNLIVIDIGNGRNVLYGNLSEVFVKKGDFISQQSLIGRINTDGVFNKPVLLFCVYDVKGGQRSFVDPFKCFDGFRRFFNER